MRGFFAFQLFYQQIGFPRKILFPPEAKMSISRAAVPTTQPVFSTLSATSSFREAGFKVDGICASIVLSAGALGSCISLSAIFESSREGSYRRKLLFITGTDLFPLDNNWAWLTDRPRAKPTKTIFNFFCICKFPTPSNKNRNDIRYLSPSAARTSSI